jgi:hypothetical protein
VIQGSSTRHSRCRNVKTFTAFPSVSLLFIETNDVNVIETHLRYNCGLHLFFSETQFHAFMLAYVLFKWE